MSIKAEWRRLRDEQPEPGTEWLWVWTRSGVEVASCDCEEAEDGKRYPSESNPWTWVARLEFANEVAGGGE